MPTSVALAKRSLKYRELIKKLKLYGVVALKKRGKGSEVILLKPEKARALQGVQYPIKNHGAGTEITIPVINALLRRFDIDKNDFWG